MALKKHTLPELTGIHTVCKLCKELKDDALFKWSGGKRVGLVCRECDRKKKQLLYSENENLREHVKAKTVRWAEENPERARAQKVAYREGNEELKAKKRAYQQANKDVENARCSEWYYKNKDTPEYKQKVLEARKLNQEQIAEACRRRYKLIPAETRRQKSQEWRDNHPGMTSFYSRRYTLDRDQRTPSWANQKVIESIYKKTPKGFAVDHIVPLRGKLVSGLHVEANLQYLPKSTNAQKLNRFFPDEFDVSYEPGAYRIGYYDGRNCCIPVGCEDEYFDESNANYVLHYGYDE